MAVRVTSLEARRRAAARAEQAARPQPTLVEVPRPRATKRPEPELLGQIVDFVTQLADAVDPEIIAKLNKEIAARTQRIPTQLNSYGYDPWGFHPDTARRVMVLSALFYRYYFRVQTFGIENLPPGRVLVIGNHAGQVAIDAAMIGAAAFLEGHPPRILRGMGEYWLPTLPFVNEIMVRTGSVVGTPKNCIDLLHHEEAVIAFPEGVRGMNKLFTQRYQLQEFGLGFVRLALETKTPIVPVAVVGSEEQAPAIANLTWLARLLDMPAFPITLTWPWLGPLGMIPFPTKYRIYFGRPMRFEGDPHDEDRVIKRHVDRVKASIQAMLNRGLHERASVFF
ncbi:MAG TPA: lysophospholipid acyltransferase family protein [Candidatus Kryptonia bacterium]|nr:lysophospholipid acyltransferase family protein [Candidatus Kryptonia bacterium]